MHPAAPAFHRVLRMLRSGLGLRDRVRLARRDSEAGVEEVQVLVAELDKMKAGTMVGGLTPPQA